jgi:hypothetical protein
MTETTSALGRITVLGKPPYVRDAASAEAWAELAKMSSQSQASYPETLEKKFKVGCDAHGAPGAPYVARGLLRDLRNRFEGHPEQEADLAKAFLDDATCPGARGLSEKEKAELRNIVDRAKQPSSVALTPQKMT